MVDFEKISDSLGLLGSGLGRMLRLVFGSQNARRLRRMRKSVDAINDCADWAADLDQAAMRAQTQAWRQELADGGKVDAILPRAFAMVREAADRSLGLRPYDVQLLGALALHSGGIAEMATGEGKTLVATLPAYLNGLCGKVYVVTVNDYLAQRDSNWMRPVFDYLGLNVAAIQSWMSPADRHPVYSADVIYGTNNEFGFDFLRDNMKSRTEDQGQRNLDFAIIDEVDSILIDEARTPLIISGPATGDADKYRQGLQVARRLRNETHFELKEKEKQAILTEEGIVVAQKALNIEDFYSGAANMEWPHVLETSLRALHLYANDVDYMVRNGEVIIVDEFTGRLMEGRRWSDGLHQAVEAKEGLRPRAQNQTLATITFQNYFRLFKKLSGMTGTAMTEAGEFASIYDLDVINIPPNRPIVRNDQKDVIYLKAEDKWKAIAEEISESHAQGQPVLVGTITIESSEMLSGMLKRRGVQHQVLNAKQHEQEASIVAQAGRKGAVTVATNMAGRGTDIVLGGNLEGLLSAEMSRQGWSEEGDGEAIASHRRQLEVQCEAERTQVLDAGGLYVLGTERHEARRIDNQLRGRCGRQGDPGRSRFFLSLDDDLMRRFYRDWVKNFLGRAGMGGGEPVESGMVSRAIEKAQKKVESYHFEMRKNLLEYDEVMDKQRHLVYDQRQDALEAKELRPKIEEMFREVIEETVSQSQGDGQDIAPDYDSISQWAHRKWGSAVALSDLEEVGLDGCAVVLREDVDRLLAHRDAEVGQEGMRELERFLLLDAIDNKWKDHLHNMDALRAGVGLRGYAQVDPKNEYKREGLEAFEGMLFLIADQVTDYILKVQIRQEDQSRLGSAWSSQEASHPAFAPALSPSQTAGPATSAPRPVAVGYGTAPSPGTTPEAPSAGSSAPPGRNRGKVARNAPCPCGSGRKYKQCCGRA